MIYTFISGGGWVGLGGVGRLTGHELLYVQACTVILEPLLNPIYRFLQLAIMVSSTICGDVEGRISIYFHLHAFGF